MYGRRIDLPSLVRVLGPDKDVGYGKSIPWHNLENNNYSAWGSFHIHNNSGSIMCYFLETPCMRIGIGGRSAGNMSLDVRP